MKAAIMAGGKGTRLASIAKDIPKPMVPVLGKPILEYQIESLKKSGITEITFIVGHIKDVIMDYFGDGSKWDVKIDYIVESEPLGTAGALFYLNGRAADDFILVFGDLILDVDFNRFMFFHKEHRAAITLYGHPNAHPYDSDVIEVDKKGKVVGILSKKLERTFYHHNFVNAGLYCMSPNVLETILSPIKLDLEKTLIAEQIELGTVYAYKSTEYVKDIGTPDRLRAVSNDMENGIVAKRSLKEKQRAVFLDRDGTINKYVGFLTRADQFTLLPGVAEAITKLNSSPFLTIVATNQPVIARGECSFEELDYIHMKMETELGKCGAYLDDIFYCPHHPNKGYTGEIPELKIDCDCRKPMTGMLTKAAERYNIDLKNSWYIGDTTMDVQTGINAGMKTILLKTGEAGLDGKYDVQPDYIADTLVDAVTLLLNR